MKIVLTAITLLAYIHFIECHGEYYEKMKEMMEKCKKEHNYEGSFKDLYKDGSTTHDKPRYCTMACINTASGVMFPNNTINVEKFISLTTNQFFIAENISNKIIADYNHDATGVSDACEAAKILYISFKNNTAHLKDCMNKIKEIFHKCTKENNPSPNFNTIIKKQEAVTEKADACTLACMDIEFGIISNDGKVNVDKLESTLKLFKIPNGSELTKKCSEAVQGISDKCEVSKSLYNCYRKKN